MNTDRQFFTIRSIADASASAASRRFIKQRTKERGKNVSHTIPDDIPDFVHNAQNYAVQDLLTVIAHVKSLFVGDFAEKEGLIARLDALESTVHKVELGVYKHGFPFDRHYEEYEELCALESELIDFSNYDYWGDGSESVLLSSLIVFWLDEIRCRGYELLSLLQGSVLHEEVVKSFLALTEIRYPENDQI